MSNKKTQKTIVYIMIGAMLASTLFMGLSVFF